MARSGPFTNLDGSGPVPASNIFRFFTETAQGKRRRSPKNAPVRRVEPDLAAIAKPPQPGEPARLTWLGHASWLVQLDGVSLLVDPALMPSISVVIKRNVAPGLTVEQLPKIDASLVSHNHYDHLDLPTLVPVGAPIVTGLQMSRHFSGTKLAVTELDWWESTSVGPVRVTFVPAQHWSRRGLTDANESLWGGFVIEGSTARLYHTGDTAYFEGFKEIGRRFPNISAAMLPIGAYDPPWFMERMHMNPPSRRCRRSSTSARGGCSPCTGGRSSSPMNRSSNRPSGSVRSGRGAGLIQRRAAFLMLGRA